MDFRWRKRQSIFYALHPSQIPVESLRLSYTWGLGGVSVLALVVTALTGVLLAFYYVPTPEQAHASLTRVEDLVFWGSWLRALHYWAGQLLLVAATLHLARVLFTGALHPPRRFNWLLGVGLLGLILLWDFSGYALRWDAQTYWALQVGAELVRTIPWLGDELYLLLMGAEQLGAAGLLRFYIWHVLGFSLLGGFGVVYHLFRLRVDGGISRPPKTEPGPRRFAPKEQLFIREIVAGLVILALLFLLALLVPAPLEPPANPASPPAEVKAPWFFLWVQTLLRWLPPFWAGVFIPTAVLAFLAALPWLGPRGRTGVWFHPRRRKVDLLFLGLVALIVLLSFL